MPEKQQLTLAELLLDEHGDDGHGRCRVCCDNGGMAGGARVRWPCWLYITAQQANQSSRR
jgi:hypothetical protein